VREYAAERLAAMPEAPAVHAARLPIPGPDGPHKSGWDRGSTLHQRNMSRVRK
jgi:hypothetical protein